jgi:hypothetical protein
MVAPDSSRGRRLVVRLSYNSSAIGTIREFLSAFPRWVCAVFRLLAEFVAIWEVQNISIRPPPSLLPLLFRAILESLSALSLLSVTHSSCSKWVYNSLPAHTLCLSPSSLVSRPSLPVFSFTFLAAHNSPKMRLNKRRIKCPLSAPGLSSQKDVSLAIAG